MRQVVACAVCAMKDWIDDYYPCHIWQAAPMVLESTLTADIEEKCKVQQDKREDEER